MKNNTITAKAAREMRGSLPDTFDAYTLTWDQIVQLIEQSAPFSDVLILKNLAAYDHLKRLEGVGFYVNTLHDPEADEHYTVIRWTYRPPLQVKLG